VLKNIEEKKRSVVDYCAHGSSCVYRRLATPVCGFPSVRRQFRLFGAAASAAALSCTPGVRWCYETRINSSTDGQAGSITTRVLPAAERRGEGVHSTRPSQPSPTCCRYRYLCPLILGDWPTAASVCPAGQSLDWVDIAIALHFRACVVRRDSRRKRFSAASACRLRGQAARLSISCGIRFSGAATVYRIIAFPTTDKHYESLYFTTQLYSSIYKLFFDRIV